MHVDQLSVNGEDYIGLLGYATDKYALLSNNFPDVEALSVPVLKTRIYGSNLAGLFCAGNSNGILAPYFISDLELKTLKEFADEIGVGVGRVEGKYTALGNLIACNDHAALISNNIRDHTTIKDVLDVEIVSGDVAGHSEVGAYTLATNKGFITHPQAENQLQDLKDILKVEGMTGTVNRGIPYVKSGLIANTHGYITGTQTTGIELQRIDDALGFF
ncbi:MAG: translation initiation factor IF-6 [Candidatus Altiarchaeales archaeon]|nr:translation initiation factor IF-6 [Candidatus Altiarchaeales archaeon]MBD3417188.1 translation initiation factor IF-6 [Candidatus Altiarchaeales archaeon]